MRFKINEQIINPTFNIMNTQDDLNTVQVELYELPISGEKGNFYGRINRTKTITEEGLIQLAAKNRSDVNPATMRLCMSLLKDVAINELLAGASVHFGLAHFNLSVNGVFVGNNPQWNADIHQLKTNISASRELNEAIKSTQPVVKGKAQDAMYITKLYDLKSKTTNKQITPGGMVNINGKRIRIVGDDPNIGIFLINVNDHTVTKIDESDISHNKPSAITMLIPPNLTAGEYQLQLVTQFITATKQLKKARTYLFEYLLSVE